MEDRFTGESNSPMACGTRESCRRVFRPYPIGSTLVSVSRIEGSVSGGYRAYLPCQRGGRLSKKAVIPSWRSAVPAIESSASEVAVHPGSSSAPSRPLTAAKQACTDSGELAAIRLASCLASVIEAPASQSTLTKPAAWALEASMGSPVSINSRARLTGKARGARNSAAQVGITPLRTSGSPNKRGRGCHHQITGQDQLQPTTQCRPLDGSDEWLTTTAADEAILTPSIGLVARRGTQVAAGAEHPISAGQNTDPEVVVILELVEGRIEGISHGPVDGVALLLPTHLDTQRVPVLVQFDSRVRHRPTRPSMLAPTLADGGALAQSPISENLQRAPAAAPEETG